MSKKAIAILGQLGLFLLAAGCVTGTGGGLLDPDLEGSLTLSGPTFGDVTLTPKVCSSGQHEVFLGADFKSPDSKLVARLVVDPLNGPGVRIFDLEARFERALVFRDEDCAEFHFSLDGNNWQLNDIDVLVVTLELDCALPGGDSVRGKLSADGCW